MRLTQFIIMENCRECNLGKFHPQCPNLHPERYGTMRQDEPVPDDVLVRVGVNAYRKFGFRGMVGFHVYNEPLMAADRMWHLMDRIKYKVPEAGFILWSNGILLPEDCEEFKRFEQIHITDYRIPKHEAKNLPRLIEACPHTKVHHWPLDNRLHGIGGEKSYRPCHRMFTEFIIDYYGNVHLCCYDWQGQASIGNVQETPLAELVAEWQRVREQIGGKAMAPDSPQACLQCKMRSAGITGFVEGPARAAREEVNRWR